MNRWRKPFTLPLLMAAGLLIVALSWLFSLPMLAEYPDLVVERSYYADESGTEDIASIQTREFTAFHGPLFRGNNSSPLWLRLTLAPSANPDWVVMYQPNYTHHIETWIPSIKGPWRKVVVGSKYAYSQRQIGTLAPSVNVQPARDHPVTIYARVITPTTPIYARVILREHVMAFDSLMHMVAGAFVGIGLLIAILSLIAYLSTKDSLWAIDCLYNIAGLSVLIFQLGLASRFIWPQSIGLVNQLGLVVNVMYLAMTSILYYRLFKLFDLPHWLLIPNIVAPLAFPYLLWLITQDQGDLAMRLNNMIILVLVIFGCCIVFVGKHADNLINWTFRITYSGLLVYFLWWLLPILFQAQNNNLSTLYPSMPISLFTMLMLLLIIARNTQLKIQESKRIEEQKREAEQELLKARQRHEESSSFYGMLLHEVKNPLSTIRMAVSNLENALVDQDISVQRRLHRVQASVDDVDEVLKRGVEVDSLEQGALVLESATINVAELVADIQARHPASMRLQSALPAILIACVDSHLLTLMMNNLIDNAVKYSPVNSPIEILLSADPDNWHLEVRNQVGMVGFPDQEQVFSKYYRSPLAARRSGMGLGLYWVRGVARRMGGDAYYMRENEWVVFGLCLPI